MATSVFWRGKACDSIFYYVEDIRWGWFEAQRIWWTVVLIQFILLPSLWYPRACYRDQPVRLDLVLGCWILLEPAWLVRKIKNLYNYIYTPEQYVSLHSPKRGFHLFVWSILHHTKGFFWSTWSFLSKIQVAANESSLQWNTDIDYYEAPVSLKVKLSTNGIGHSFDLSIKWPYDSIIARHEAWW